MTAASDDEPGIASRAIRRGRDVARAAVRGVADLMMPPVCLACHAPLASHDALCAACWQRVSFIRPPVCDRLGTPMPFDPGGRIVSAAAEARPPAFDRLRAVARFDDVMRKLVHDLKFRDRHDGRRLLGRWLADAGRELLADADVLAPVPLNRVRLLERRFNQSAILAAEASRLAGVPYDPLLLVRTRRTTPQVGLTEEQRRANVAGAFALTAGRGRRIDGGNVVLVDDVVTTGATVEACARVLKREGAARVDVLALSLVCDPEVVSA